MSEEIGAPRGFVGTRNIALDRALGSPGIPLGRMTEISGWPGAGKSTLLDQLLAQCQADGGVGVLADTERSRNRPYMASLGVRPESLVWIGGKTVELMFDEIETLARTSAHLNCLAWYEALVRAGVRCPKPNLYKHEIHGEKDSKGTRKKLATFTFSQWGREQAAALLEFQKDHPDLSPSSIRDASSRAVLRPVVLYGESEADKKEALAAWLAGEPHPLAQPADRPIVIGWDSVAGTATEAELDGDARDQHPATAAKVIRRNLRRLIQLIDDEAIAFVLVNQRYERIAMGGRRFGGGSETYGGGGIKYHTTLRIEVDKIGDIYNKSADKGAGIPPIGQIVRIKIPKNKINDPFHSEEYGLVFGRGADNAWAMFQDLKARGIIRQGGAWCRFSDPSILGEADRAFMGWQELSNMMAEDDGLWDRLRGIYMEGRGV
jgi:RecA/RadA recombinase